jgi:hypothetical protein
MAYQCTYEHRDMECTVFSSSGILTIKKVGDEEFTKEFPHTFELSS